MSRLYYLDAMRSILMMLGIVLHAAVIFSDGSWLLNPNQTSSNYNALIDFIHLFRMPAFFIVSGFFCHMTLTRYGSRLFLKIRTPRIIIPLVITAISLNSMQNWFLQDYRQTSVILFSLEYWFQGAWLSHLWFLVSLIYYFVITAVVCFIFKPIINKILSISALIYLKSGWFSLALLTLVTLILTKASYLINSMIPEGNFDWVLIDSIGYSAFFIFGFMAGSDRAVLERFTSFSATTLILTSLFIITGYYSLDHLQGSALNTVSLLTSLLTSWLLCNICFLLFKKLTNKSSKVFLYFSEASYSIYLFHHILVIVYATYLLQLNLPFWLTYILLTTMTFISTVIIHHYIIRNIPILKFLFNGKR